MKRISCIFGLLFTLVAAQAFGATYYVDFDAGKDSNPGTTLQPWKTLPGTRNVQNSGWQSTDWGNGTINSRNRVQPGTYFKIKSGSVHNSSDGGRIVIDSTFYQSGTSSSPITIERDISWGTGNVVIDGSGMTLGSYDALFFIGPIDYIHINGHTQSGIEINNSPRRGLEHIGTSEASMSRGFEARYLKVFNAVSYGIDLQRASNWVLDHLESDGNDQDGTTATGFVIGDSSRGCDNGVISNSSSHDWGNSPGTQMGGTSARIGFVILDSHNITLDNVTSYDNEGDGIDIGTVSDSRLADNIIVKNSTSYNNFDGFACNVANAPGESRIYFYNNISYGNADGFNVYEGPTAYIYGNVIHGNRHGLYADAPAQSSRDTVIYMKNNIFYKNTTNDIDILRATDMTLHSDYNLFEKGTSNTIIRWNYGVAGGNATYVYSGSGKLLDDWAAEKNQDVHSYDSVVDGMTASFVDPDGHNYTLSASSDVIDIGENLGAPYELDRVGVYRPQGGGWDLGAYEYSIGQAESVPAPPTNLRVVVVN